MALHVPPTRRWSALAAAVLAAGTLAACGSDDDDASSASAGATATTTEPAREPAYANDETGTETARSGVAGATGAKLALVAEESGGLRFDRSALRASAGEVVIALDNPSGNQLPHAVEIEGQGVEEESATIEPGATSEVKADLRPGRYTFYCPVGDHRQQGMEGTLTVG